MYRDTLPVNGLQLSDQTLNHMLCRNIFCIYLAFSLKTLCRMQIDVEGLTVPPQTIFPTDLPRYLLRNIYTSKFVTFNIDNNICKTRKVKRRLAVRKKTPAKNSLISSKLQLLIMDNLRD